MVMSSCDRPLSSSDDEAKFSSPHILDQASSPTSQHQRAQTYQLLTMGCSFVLEQTRKAIHDHFTLQGKRSGPPAPKKLTENFLKIVLSSWKQSVDPTGIFLRPQDLPYLEEVFYSSHNKDLSDPTSEKTPSLAHTLVPSSYGLLCQAMKTLMKKRIQQTLNYWQKLKNHSSSFLTHRGSLWRYTSLDASSLLLAQNLPPRSIQRDKYLKERLQIEYALLSSTALPSTSTDLLPLSASSFISSKIEVLQNHQKKWFQLEHHLITLMQTLLRSLNPENSYFKNHPPPTLKGKWAVEIHINRQGLAEVQRVPRSFMSKENAPRPGDILLSLSPSPHSPPLSLVDRLLSDIYQILDENSSATSSLKILRKKAGDGDDQKSFAVLKVSWRSYKRPIERTRAEIKTANSHQEEQEENEELMQKSQEESHHSEEEARHKMLFSALMLHAEDIYELEGEDEKVSISQDIHKALLHFISSTSPFLLRAVILDLRGSTSKVPLNYQEVPRTLSLFIPASSLRSSIKIQGAMKDKAPQPLPASVALWKGPLVVLVDRCTSLGGEVMAAAFKAHHRALILGEPTSGYSPLQTLHKIPERTGDALILHSSYLHGLGFRNHLSITPHIKIPFPPNCLKPPPKHHIPSLHQEPSPPTPIPPPYPSILTEQLIPWLTTRHSSSSTTRSWLPGWLQRKHLGQERPQNQSTIEKISLIKNLTISEVKDLTDGDPPELSHDHDHHSDPFYEHTLAIARDYSIYLKGGIHYSAPASKKAQP